jgi:solute carrier family 6 amino acid transporter-like protein 5/7/9/14
MRGIKSSGKVAYVTGIAPFIFLVIFLIRALTLPGALNGIAYFFTPKWEDILKPSVWYAACTQLFFSLNVFFANIIMYASYNKFTHKIYRDSNIVTTIDTFTSLLAGCITFGIVGHLAHELGVDDISKVFKAGPGLVFITYAETISKFRVMPQIFSILFFLMLYILGMGSLLAMTSCVITVVRDQFKGVQNWHAALGYSIFGVLCGSLYTTPVS